MINEKPNSNSDWINKLDELESIHGASFNKATSWNKLHERLYSKSNKRKVVWYWFAAASLFFALFITLFTLHKKENVFVNNGLGTKKSNPPLVQNIPMVNNDSSSILSSLLNKNKLPVHSIYETQKRNSHIKNEIIIEKIIQNKKDIEIVPELAKSAVMLVDTAISLVTINAPVKKKLMVVHVNELGEPLEESPNIARNNEQHSFQFRFMNQEVYTRSSPSVTKTGFKIFTTKSLTTN